MMTPEQIKLLLEPILEALKSANDELKELAQEIAALKADKSEAVETLSEQAEQIKRLEQDAALKDKRAEDLEEALEVEKKTIKWLSEELGTIKTVNASTDTAIKEQTERIKALEETRPEKGDKGDTGEKGDKGDRGAGVIDALVNRAGELVLTFEDGVTKSLGQIIGKDGVDGKDGADGVTFDSVDVEYLPETHEINLSVTASGKTKSLKYPAGGISMGGYWREGRTAKAGEAWTMGGSLWIATKETTENPALSSKNWVLCARSGRDASVPVKTTINEKPIQVNHG